MIKSLEINPRLIKNMYEIIEIETRIHVIFNKIISNFIYYLTFKVKITQR